VALATLTTLSINPSQAAAGSSLAINMAVLVLFNFVETLSSVSIWVDEVRCQPWL
jgi:hypothetical protein